jgi:hypothetical protein
MQIDMFYNTTGETPEKIKEYEQHNGTQNGRILHIFKLVGKPLTPEDVEAIYCRQYPAALLTSIRRGISNLTREGYLRETGNKKPGKFGRMIKTWIAI